MKDVKWLFTDNKFHHILAGAVLSQVLVLILSLFTSSICLPIFMSLLISSMAAYGNELLIDGVLGLGKYSLKDFIASEIGVIYGVIVSLLFLLL